MGQHSYSIIVIVALILFSMYRRVRRNIGWQPLNPGSLKFRRILFVAIGLLFFVEGASHPVSLISDIAGLALGAGLAFYSAGITDFDFRDGKMLYRPNIWIGSVVTLLFIVRFLARFYGLFASGALNGAGQANSMQNMGYTVGNSWTAGLLLIMFAYYAVYYSIIMNKQKEISQKETI